MYIYIYIYIYTHIYTCDAEINKEMDLKGQA